MPNPEDITDVTTTMIMALVLMAKAFKLNYSTLTNNNQRISSNPRNRQIAQPGMNMGQDKHKQMVRCNGGNRFRQYARQNVGNQNGYNAVQNVRIQVVQNAVQNLGVQNVRNQNRLIVVPGIANQNSNRNDNVVAARAEGNEIGNNTRIQPQAKEFDLMAAAADLDEIEKVNANCILTANLQRASTSGTQTDKAPVYDSDRSPKNDNNVISVVSSVEQDGGTVDQHPVTAEETSAYFNSLYNNLAMEVEKVYSVNRKMKETNADLTIELARYKNQENANFKIQFLKEAAKFVRDFQSFANEADESFAKHKALELEIKHLLRGVVSQDIMSIVHNNSVVDTLNLQTNLEHTKDHFENSYNDMQQKIERLQAQLGDQKGKSVDNTTKTKRLQPKSNTKNDRVPSASKSSYSKNKEV
nr:hypothetical protein [Tanacetum cinerariifolium]